MAPTEAMVWLMEVTFKRNVVLLEAIATALPQNTTNHLHLLTAAVPKITVVVGVTRTLVYLQEELELITTGMSHCTHDIIVNSSQANRLKLERWSSL